MREKSTRDVQSRASAFVRKLTRFGLVTLLIAPAGALAAQFEDIARGDRAGIEYRSHERITDFLLDRLKQQDVLEVPEDLARVPGKSRGNPGVALFDYDNDGDVDMFVSDSSRTHSSVLYANQLADSGELRFENVTEAAGLATAEPLHAGSGICYADTDNDGDQDLYVVGRPHNQFYENQGDGTFKDISASSNLDAVMFASSCSFGDVNGDGLVDLVVSNSFDNPSHRLPLRFFRFGHLSQPNRLYLNLGQNEFKEISAQSGIQNVARITWAVALVDYDLDGDLEYVSADDQGPKPPAVLGGQDRGYVRIYDNDGTGRFTDITTEVGTDRYGAWMGLSFADYNHDGNMDFFATNVGNYSAAYRDPIVNAGSNWPSTWFLGQDDGSFVEGERDEVGATPFGWSASSFDYDNDADTDVLFVGGVDIGTILVSNPGALLENDGKANFERSGALPRSAYHVRRNTQGAAVADLDGDGYYDIVDASNQNWPLSQPLIEYPPRGGQFDGIAQYWPTFSPIDPDNFFAGFTWNGVEPVNGTLSVKINRNTGMNWVKIDTLGTVGITSEGQVNRDGIGAVVKVTPHGGETAMRPVLSGASHTSADSLTLGFGLGEAGRATVEILWPGGVRNRIYDVQASEALEVPEIPCSFDTARPLGRYMHCVTGALRELRRAGVVEPRQAERLRSSARRAYLEAHDAGRDAAR